MDDARDHTVMTSAPARARLIVALDTPDPDRAESLVRSLAPLGVIFKVGYEAFYGYEPRIRAAIDAVGADRFVDVKLHDIPRTVAAGIRALVAPNVRIITVHALGGARMLEAAVCAANERASELSIPAPEIFAVTVLTSIESFEYEELGLSGGPGENAIRLGALARDARCAGIVCSGGELADLKSFFGSEIKGLIPGVRPIGALFGDQARVVTPREAVEAGADYLVVGRPILEAADPVAAARRILEEMDAAAGSTARSAGNGLAGSPRATEELTDDVG